MNPFDAAVYACLSVAIVMGYQTGLLRSLATILGYLAAMPVAGLAAPWIALVLLQHFDWALTQTWWLTLFGTFLVMGMVLSLLLRRVLGMLVGPQVSLPDRMAGMAFGIVRIGLIAVLMVMIFDRIIPPGMQPSFLAGSQLRPILSQAGQLGLRSLPPEVGELIDRLKPVRWKARGHIQRAGMKSDFIHEFPTAAHHSDAPLRDIVPFGPGLRLTNRYEKNGPQRKASSHCSQPRLAGTGPSHG